ncbi:hypothetical protein AMECASPLE_030421 [Ameca splendens]|uniref:Secreted protein n=1 Tax=Ameca splendens TaxID=208324 RepID=A0ABV0XJ36_9TELE
MAKPCTLFFGMSPGLTSFFTVIDWSSTWITAAKAASVFICLLPMHSTPSLLRQIAAQLSRHSHDLLHKSPSLLSTKTWWDVWIGALNTSHEL